MGQYMQDLECFHMARLSGSAQFSSWKHPRSFVRRCLSLISGVKRMRRKSEHPKSASKVNHRVMLHGGSVFQLFKESVTLPNMVTIDLDIIRHPGASATVPIDENNAVILIKQYRHAIGDFIWEIPAGTLDPHESPLACAKRELMEETGFSARRWQKLGEITPVPGYSDERIHLFLALQLSAAAQQSLDKDEVLNVRRQHLEDAIEMIYKGVIQDGKTIAGLLLAHHRLKQKSDGGVSTPAENEVLKDV